MARTVAQMVAATIRDLREKSESNQVGLNAQRVSGTLDSSNALPRGADLNVAKVMGADLPEANLIHSHLMGATPEDPDFQGAILKGGDANAVAIQRVRLAPIWLFASYNQFALTTAAGRSIRQKRFLAVSELSFSKPRRRPDFHHGLESELLAADLDSHE